MLNSHILSEISDYRSSDIRDSMDLRLLFGASMRLQNTVMEVQIDKKKT